MTTRPTLRPKRSRTTKRATRRRPCSALRAGRRCRATVDPDPGTEFFNGMDNGWTAYLAEHYTDTTEENRAFIAWAGSWAEARYLDPDDPWRVLAGIQQTDGSSDMVRVYDYWRDPAHDPHDTEEQWAPATGPCVVTRRGAGQATRAAAPRPLTAAPRGTVLRRGRDVPKPGAPRPPAACPRDQVSCGDHDGDHCIPPDARQQRRITGAPAAHVLCRCSGGPGIGCDVRISVLAPVSTCRHYAASSRTAERQMSEHVWCHGPRPRRTTARVGRTDIVFWVTVHGVRFIQPRPRWATWSRRSLTTTAAT